MGIPYIGGKYPKSSLALSLTITSLLLWATFQHKPHLVLSFDEGYTTTNAPSIKELQAQIDFFDNQGTPWYMALFAEPRAENGSMIESNEFHEFKRFYRSIKSNITIRSVIEEDRQANLTYMDYCGSMCNFNEVIFKTFSMAWFGFDWPVTKIISYQSNIGKYFFQRTMNGDSIESAKLAALYFMVFINSTEMSGDLREFERLVQIEVEKHNADPTTKTILTQHGARGMELEIERATNTAQQFLLTGLVIFIVICFVSLVVLSWSQKRLSGCIVFVATAAIVLVPISSLICTMGIFGLTGWHVNTLSIITAIFIFPYILINVFQLFNVWLIRSNLDQSVDAQTLDNTLSMGGHFIFTNVIYSLIILVAGFLFFIPEIGNLLKFIGISIFFAHFHIMHLLLPFLLWCTPLTTHKKLQDSEKANNGCAELNHSFTHRTIITAFSKTVRKMKKVSLTTASSLLIIIGCLSIWGFTQAHGNLDYRHLLLPDSPNNKGVHLMSDVVWPDFLHILFIMESPPDFENPVEYQQFKGFTREIQEIRGAIGPESDMVWTFDYERFSESPSDARVLNMSMFKSFITHEVYNAWASGLRYKMDGDKPIITKMIYMVGINGTTTMADKAQLMADCRRVSSHYPQFKAIPFDTEVGMTDVITQVPETLIWVPAVIIMIQTLTMFSKKWIVESAVFQFISFGGAILMPALFGITFNPFSVALGIYLSVFSSIIPRHMIQFFVHSQQVDDEEPEEAYTERKKVRKAEEALERSWLPSILGVIVCTCIFLPFLYCPVLIFYNLAIINFIFLIIFFIVISFILPVFLLVFRGTDY
ncbi:unnamed protein product [Auanema sp. JU1783]|nr:unnamed protein product [Auanema sp. JU1783]